MQLADTPTLRPETLTDVAIGLGIGDQPLHGGMRRCPSRSAPLSVFPSGASSGTYTAAVAGHLST
jgi:hypothetical protein